MCKVLFWFPSVIRGGVAFPFDEVFYVGFVPEHVISETFDLLRHINYVALFIHRRQLRKNLDMLSDMWFQQGYMENIMDPIHSRW